ncbi:MAG: S53 family peptidase [Actinomycetota bacterium]|nr:S53 family peptidase [Actinomycetota bacterium]
MFRPTLRRQLTLLSPLAVVALAAFGAGPPTVGHSARLAAQPAPRPAVSEFTHLKAGEIPPTEAECYSAGRRCFTPQSLRASYGVDKLIAAGKDGRGRTIAIVDAFGYPTVASDLKVYSQRFGLPMMCGFPGVTCTTGLPTFSELKQGNTQVKAPPSGSHGTGQEARNAWALEVALDVQMAHATAPMANILLVTTPTAETLGVQGFPQFMNAEQYVIDHGLADVITQSFGSGEEAFGSPQSLLNLRHAFVSAAASGVTVLASSGDGGSANNYKQPVKNPRVIPFPSVGWPASDPLVTGVGGTYLCTDAETGTHVDSVHPGGKCPLYPGAREVAWTFSGGGFSHVFARPSYQNPATAPAGSYPYTGMRGVPDVAYQASAGTGPLIYDTAPGDVSSGLICPSGDPCSSGWYVVGGTSASSPQWAGLVAITDQIAGQRLGLINDDLYALAASSTTYAAAFNDIATMNTNQTDPSIAGYPATPGWDPVTGLGTPKADVLLPALAAAAKLTAP